MILQTVVQISGSVEPYFKSPPKMTPKILRGKSLLAGLSCDFPPIKKAAPLSRNRLSRIVGKAYGDLVTGKESTTLAYGMPIVVFTSPTYAT
mgnify:FL=1